MLDVPKETANDGMTFRDYAAVAILQALVSRGTLKGDRVKDAITAYEYADAMVEARDHSEKLETGQIKASSEKTTLDNSVGRRSRRTAIALNLRQLSRVVAAIRSCLRRSGGPIEVPVEATISSEIAPRPM